MTPSRARRVAWRRGKSEQDEKVMNEEQNIEKVTQERRRNLIIMFLA